MQITADFYNKTNTDLLAKYFPTLKWFRDNPTAQKMCYAVEMFNNGCISYPTLIKRIELHTKATQTEIHNIVEKYINFDGYIFTPKN